MRTEARATPVIEHSIASRSMIGSDLARTGTIESKHLVARYILFAVLSSSGVIWDLWSKWFVFDWLGAAGQHLVWAGSLLGIPTRFELATTFNRGALWGMGQGQTWLFATMSILAVGVIAYFLWTSQAVESWWLTIASGLLLAGTLGNLYDRLGLHGWKDNGSHLYAVRDFLDFVFFNGGFHWATFNFADSYLVVGATMLVLQSFWRPKEPLTASSIKA